MGYPQKTAALLLAVLLVHKVQQTSSFHLNKAEYNDSHEHTDDDVFNRLQLVEDKAMETVVPLEIVVDEDFTGWKQLLEETTSPSYALEILNKNLPVELATCYNNMTKEKMESDVHSPAEYGDRMCGKLEEAASCTDKELRDNKKGRLLQFTKEVKHLREALCDPDCPFAQAESCKTHLVTTSSNSSQCGISGALECADTLLTELKCKPEAIAVVYWMQTKVLAKLKKCENESEECLANVRVCLKPFSDYLRSPNLLHLCRGQSRTTYCINMVQGCSRGAAEVLNAATGLLKDMCNQLIGIL